MKRKIIFMGSDPIALPSLEFLVGEAAAEVEIAGIYTQPDRPAGRGKKLQANAIKQWALARGIAVRQPEKLGDTEVNWIEETGCEMMLVMAYGHILRRRFIECPPLGTFNLHASLLPKYRGASPIQSAVASGEPETGVTLMRMVRKMDAGPIVDQEAFPVERLETGETAIAKIAAACVPLLRRNLTVMLEGRISVREQDEGLATYTRKLEKEDGGLDFSASAQSLARRINGLFPWPGCFFNCREQRIKVGLADWNDENSAAEPGTVVSRDETELRIATGSGTLCLLLLQRPGGRLLPVGDFSRGFQMLPGSRLSSSPMTPLVSREPFPYVRR
ncbi:MAG: methionyl-tRNA formyltransferase [Opitutales bacterium]